MAASTGGRRSSVVVAPCVASDVVGSAAGHAWSMELIEALALVDANGLDIPRSCAELQRPSAPRSLDARASRGEAQRLARQQRGLAAAR